MDPQHLGDGVYLRQDLAIPRDLVICTEDHESTITRIYLEPEVVKALIRFVTQHRKEHQLDPSV